MTIGWPIRTFGRRSLTLFVWGMILLSLSGGNCYASALSEARAKFYRANAHYSEGKYDKAIAAYREVLALGFESGNLYYNLGNCYFKKGELGRAIFNYEKAKRLIPQDSDLKSNYDYARTLIKGGGVGENRKWFVRFPDRIFGRFTINGLVIFLSALYTGILIIALCGVFVPSLKRYCIWVAIILAFIFALGFFSFYSKVVILGKEAVVVVERVDVKFEPFQRATTHFTLYEGMKVKVLLSGNSWSKIRRSDGKTGWVPNEGIEIF